MEAQELERQAEDYQRVENAIRYIEQNRHGQPGLQQIAKQVGLSEFHFQRLFGRWVGISPKRFLQYLTKEYAKTLLKASRDVLKTAYDSGLSAPSRLYDLFVSCEAVTPGEYKTGGARLQITYGIHPSPFGHCLIATTARGICAFQFNQGQSERQMCTELQRQWPQAVLSTNASHTAALIKTIFSAPRQSRPVPLHLHLRGTNFQIKVWEALIRIPFGTVTTYQDVARLVDNPKGARAVGNAVGQNPVPFLVPCHRVIRKDGSYGNYGGGPARKKALLGWEAALINEPLR
jgi:AraC family transcriptional regulator of adaptative response/methylated-DNA-[protein]-cysteine methyltransferase